MNNQPSYQCPICSQSLTANAQGFSCSDYHSFDRAKEGYVNLLPVQHKASKVPGDSPAMVTARRDFLATDHYEFLRQQILLNLTELLSADQASDPQIIDIGCGEGYYTNYFAEQLTTGDQPSLTYYGIDIAKTAIRYAAKRSQNVHFAVASHLKLPFADQSTTIVTKIFAPMTAAEVARVLRPEGHFISVVPGPDHLFELKQKIYESPKHHEDETVPEGFERRHSQRCSQTVTLTDGVQIKNLTEMTPFAWKLQAPEKQQLADSAPLTMTFDFVINHYQVLSSASSSESQSEGESTSTSEVESD